MSCAGYHDAVATDVSRDDQPAYAEAKCGNAGVATHGAVGPADRPKVFVDTYKMFGGVAGGCSTNSLYLVLVV